MATLGTDTVAAKRQTRACQESARAKAAELQHVDELQCVLREDVCSAQKVLDRLTQEGAALGQQLECAEATAETPNWSAPSRVHPVPSKRSVWVLYERHMQAC